jgi:polysaccharide deacetylase 2 family uncharacterized protein YibQ
MGWAVSFRPLVLFWAVVLGLTAGCAVALQLLGPPPSLHAGPHAAGPAGPAPRAQALPNPARLAPSRTDAAPPLPLTTASIPEPDSALEEPAIEYPDRMLPRISDNGVPPSKLYAAAFDPAERHPRVALVIDGAGLDRAWTELTLRTLPSAIDVAFSAYAPSATAAALAQTARRSGRECLVSIPMEPSGFPVMEEGDKSLLLSADPAQNRANLDWALSNVQGCVGATGGSDGLNGERYAESREAFGDLLSTVARRGLIYLDARPEAQPPEDSGGAGRSLPRVVDVLVNVSTPLDEPTSAQTIDQNLAHLEQIAARSGFAIGLAGPPTPVLLERVAVWAQGLASRGIVLAPLSAIPAPKPSIYPPSP